MNQKDMFEFFEGFDVSTWFFLKMNHLKLFLRKSKLKERKYHAKGRSTS